MSSINKRKKDLKSHFFTNKALPNDIILTIGIWIDNTTTDKARKEIGIKLAKTLGVDFESVELEAYSDSEKDIICTEISVDNKEGKALDWIIKEQDKVDKALKVFGLNCGVILD